jgi:RimJ/RimL family protein N-acetyltransferase
MRFAVEPSPKGGYQVVSETVAMTVSQHDTEEEALERAAAYGAASRGQATDELELRDGTRVLVRPMTADDKALLQEGFAQLSPESRYMRFLGAKKRLSIEELELLTEIDHHDREALGALDPETGEGMAVARYFRDPDHPESAEAAVTVVDAWQGRGLGSALLRRLVERAREEDIERFTATLFTENRDMLHLFERIGEVRTVGREGSTHEIEIEFPLDREALGSAMRAAAEGAARVDPPTPAS